MYSIHLLSHDLSFRNRVERKNKPKCMIQRKNIMPKLLKYSIYSGKQLSDSTWVGILTRTSRKGCVHIIFNHNLKIFAVAGVGQLKLKFHSQAICEKYKFQWNIFNDKEQAIRQLEKKSTSNIDRFSSYSVLSVPLESVIVFWI